MTWYGATTQGAAALSSAGGGPTGMNVPLYMLQDANYNVVALVRGRGGSAFPNAQGTVIEQWTYSPYGEVLASEWWHPAGQGPTPAEPNHPNPPANYKRPLNPVGHQGLFAIRLDAAATSSPLESGADLRLYGRNRIYHPEFGQWTTADPVGASAPVLSTEAFHGRPIAVEATAYSGSTKYVDGMNLYAAVESNPIRNRDPLGLFTLIEMTAVTGFQLDSTHDTLDMGYSLLDAFRGLGDLIEERNSDLEGVAEAAGDGTLDLALADFEESQALRHRMLTGLGMMGGLIARGARAAGAADDALPDDFHKGPKKTTVYIGYDKSGNAAYVGITDDLARRRKEWQGIYEIKKHVTDLTRKEALAVEQLIKQNNSFNNVRNPISPRHKWSGKAVDWASGFMRKKGKPIRF